MARLAVLPGAVLMAGLFFLPLVFILVYSLWQTDARLNIVATWNVDNYARFFESPTYLRTLAKTVVMAAAVTAAAVIVAIPVAYFLTRYVSRRWARIALIAVILPFWTSYLLRVYAWTAILGEKGALNQLLLWTGAIAEPSRMLVYSDLGVFIVLLYVYFPFAVLALYASLERFDFAQLTAAQDLGARPRQALRRILLPQIRAGMVTASIFVFIPILGEFVTPTLVGGAGGRLIANSIVDFFRGGLIPEGAALAFVVAAFATILLVALRRFLQVEDVVARG